MATNNPDLVVTLKGDASNFSNNFQKAQADFKAAMAAIAAESKRTKTDLDAAFGALNIRTGDQIAQEGAKVRAAFELIKNSADSTSNEVQRASEAMKAKLKELGAEAGGASTVVTNFGGSFGGLGAKIAASVAAVVSIGVAIKGVKDVMSAGMGFEQLHNQLVSATGSAAQADKTYASLRETARGLGVSFTDISKSAIGFISATKGTAMEGEKALQIFKGFTTLGAATGRSNQDMERTFVGLQQIISKGTISAEEWKGQIGDALPAANAYLQKALGKTQQEIMKLMETGSISSDVLIKVAQAMQLENAAAGAKNAETLQGKLNLLKDTIGDLYVKISNSSAMEAFKGALDKIQQRLTQMASDGSLDKMAKSVGELIANMVIGLMKLGEFLASNAKAIAAFIAAFAGMAALSSIVGIFTTLSGAVALLGGGVAVATGGLVALGVAAGAVGLAGLGAGLVQLYEKFVGVTVSAKKSEEAVDKFKRSLGEIKAVNTSQLLGDNDAQLAARLSGIEEAFKQRNEKIIASDKKAAEAYSKTMDDRLTETVRNTDSILARERNLKDTLEGLEKRKAAMDEQHRQESEKAEQQKINNEISANNQKNTTLLAADQKLAKDQAALAALSGGGKKVKDAQEAARQLIAIDKGVIDSFKQHAQEQSANEKIASEQRIAQQKVEANALTTSINNTKAAIKAAEKERETYSSERLRADLVINETRAKQLAEIEKKITANIKLESKLMEEAKREASMNGVKIIQEGGVKEVEALKAANAENIKAIKERYNQAIEQGKGWLEKMGVQTKRISELHKQADDEIKASNKATSEAIIKQKETEAASLKGLLTSYENEYKQHLDKIKSLQESIDKKIRSGDEKQFEIRIKGYEKEEEASARMARAKDLRSQAEAKYAELASAKGDDRVKKEKELQVIIEEGKKQLEDTLSLWNKNEKGILGSADLKQKIAEAFKSFNDLSIEAEKSGIAVSEGLAKGLIAPIAKVKSDLEGLQKQMKEMGEAFRINPQIDPAALTKIATDIKTAFDSSKDNEVKIKADITEAVTKIATLTKGEDKSIKANVDDVAFKAAIAEDVRTEYKTIVVNKVAGSDSSGSGGGFSMFADGGLITGPGTGTSDSIPALVSNGEYVIRAAAVQKFGANFFNNLNNGFMPHSANMPRFAEGGLVGGSNKADTVNINLSIGNKSFAMSGAREQAMGLAQALQQLSRAA